MNVIVDNDGRVGVITEVREDGVFARPANMHYREDAAGLVPGISGGTAITATWWQLEEDGTCTGYWCNDSLGTMRTARWSA